MTELADQHPHRGALRRLLVAGLCVAGIVAVAQDAPALLSRMDLRTCVRTAGVAFAGTVTGIRAERLEGTVVTRVTFSDVVYAKGARSAKSLILTTCGGEVDGESIWCEDEPVFHLHQRYILLAAADLGSHRNGYSSIVGANQGMFLLEAEKPGGRPVVPGVIGYRNGRLLMKERRADPTVRPDPGSRFNEKQFLDLIRKVDKEP